MSTGDHPDDSAEEMPTSLPPLKWSREIFDGLVKNFKFPKSWGVIYPEEGQTAAQATAGYITLFWDYFTDGNFHLPVTRFVLDILGYYKFHISQLNPMGMVRIRHFEFLCRSMHIEPTVDRFRVSINFIIHSVSIRLLNIQQQKRLCFLLQSLSMNGNPSFFTSRPE
ncbi:hypothetical protein HanPI659440_Chr13g0501211 [Helianthus annuus]|nr:hypothetical protein HanPI659440_Chr13g0501211 [Helianthus annuus]